MPGRDPEKGRRMAVGAQWQGGLSKEQMFQQRAKTKEGGTCENVWKWRGYIPGGGDSMWKGPEGGH